MKTRLLSALIAILLCVSLCSCQLFVPAPTSGSRSTPATSHTDTSVTSEEDIQATLAALAGADPRRDITAGFLRWGNEAIDPAFTAKISGYLQTAAYTDDLFYELFGSTLLVLYDLYTAAPGTASNLHMAQDSATQPVLAFTGDVNLSDTWENMVYMAAQPAGIQDCITQPLRQRMQTADLLLINNEFCFSDQGTAMPGKQYTFRAKTENAQILNELGVDIVSLANNHVYDFGEAAFLDTLDTLSAAGIPYVGAGRTIDEASLPQYFLVGGMKVAYVAASRAEKNILTPEATETTPGVLRTYDPALFLAAVQLAAENADVVVAYPHWGTENSTTLEDAQTTLARQLIDAGADLVVGAHPHILQGIEFYKDKPIVYSLGNFWFNTAAVDTALLEVTLNDPHNLSLRVAPCLQSGGVTTLLQQDTDRQRIFDLLSSISPSPITFAADGLVQPAA